MVLGSLDLIPQNSLATKGLAASQA